MLCVATEAIWVSEVEGGVALSLCIKSLVLIRNNWVHIWECIGYILGLVIRWNVGQSILYCFTYAVLVFISETKNTFLLYLEAVIYSQFVMHVLPINSTVSVLPAFLLFWCPDFKLDVYRHSMQYYRLSIIYIYICNCFVAFCICCHTGVQQGVYTLSCCAQISIIDYISNMLIKLRLYCLWYTLLQAGTRCSKPVHFSLRTQKIQP